MNPSTIELATGSAETMSMSTREIAELTGKEHKTVLYDVRCMFLQLGKATADFSAVASVPGANGATRRVPIFNLPKDLTLTLVTGYSAPLRHKIVVRPRLRRSVDGAGSRQNALMNPTAPAALTMSTREIAELTGKRHDHVIRDTRAMLDELGDAPDLGNVREEKDARGYTAAFHLPKDLTLTLVAGYSVPLRHRIVTRLQELEAQLRAPALPNFSDPAEAAMAWAAQYREKQALALRGTRCMLLQLGRATADFSAVASVPGANGAARRVPVFNLPKGRPMLHKIVT